MIFQLCLYHADIFFLNFPRYSFFPNPVQFHDIHILTRGCSSLCCSMSTGYNDGMISLLTVPIGKRARLVSVSRDLRSRLRQSGLHIGDELRVLRSAPLGGPLLIEVGDRELALGGVLAEKIFVELICESR